MDSREFLEHFNDLSDESIEERCRATEGIMKVLQNGNSTSSKNKDLSYAAKRLIRGCTSGRRSCRQGFCLAVTELLRVFPAQTIEVLQLIKQTTEVQSGMRQHEQKDRLLGRLFAHVAILEAQVFRIELGNSEPSAFRSSRQQIEAAKEISEGLRSVCSARPYLRAPSIGAMSTLCRDLCAAGAAAQVPEILVPWGLESAMTVNSEGTLDALMAGLVLNLRVMYEKGVAGAEHKDSYKGWPSVLKKDTFAEPSRLTALAKGLSKLIEGAQFGDTVPQTIDAICAWLLHPAGKREPVKLQDVIWPAMDDGLFGPELPAAAHAQGLCTLAEVAKCIKVHCADTKSDAGETLLVGIFTKFTKGIDLWLRSLNYSKAALHHVAKHTQFQFQTLIVGPVAGQQAPAKRKKKTKQDKFKSGEQADSPWSLTDGTRLKILELLRWHRDFAFTPRVFRLQWQASLIAPLSSAGVRSLCTNLLREIRESSPQPVDKDRAMAERLGQLALHGNAPDTAILAVICTCFSASYCIPKDTSASGYPLSEFLHSLGIKGSDAEDLIIPAPVRALPDKSKEPDENESAEDTDAERKQMWRTKLWALLAALCKRTSPEAAAALTSAADGQESALRTRAYQGCLADGSLFLSRLHDWWDHSAAQPSPQPPKKKKRSSVEGTGSTVNALCPPIELEPERKKLRERCVELARQLLSDEAVSGLEKRQRTALASLLFSLGLGLLGALSGASRDDEEETEESVDAAEDAVTLLEGLLGPEAPDKRKKKKRGSGQKSREEIFAATLEMAAQLFVTQVGLVKETARHVWRELIDYAPEETIFRLCASLKGNPDEDPEDDDLQQDSDEDFKPIDKSKLKKKKNADDEEDDEDQEGDDDDDDDADEDAGSVPFAAPIPGGEDGDEILLDADGIFDQLLDDDPNASSLASAFASSSLQDDNDSSKAKKSKRQQRIQQKREFVMQKMRELELVELFINQTVTKKVNGIRAIQELFSALLATSTRVRASTKDKKSSKILGKSDESLEQLERDLVRRAAEVVARGLRIAGKGSTVCVFLTPEEWAKACEELLNSILSVTAVPPPVAMEVAATFLYWTCSVARAASLDGQKLEDDTIGWDVARKTLEKVLEEWSLNTKSDIAIRCCPVILRVFAQRSPKLVLQLEWCKFITQCEKYYVRREQVSFVIERLLKDPKPLGAPEVSGAQFAESFGTLCIQFLEVESRQNGCQAEGQERKLQREALAGLAAALRALTKLKGTGSKASLFVDKSVIARAIAAVNPVRDSVTNKRGELYQLCMHTLRLLGSSAPQSPKFGSTASPSSPRLVPVDGSTTPRENKQNSTGDRGRSPSNPTTNKERKKDGKRAASQSPKRGPQKAPQSPKLGPKKKTPKVDKGAAEFFDSM
eukprot:gnl/MRDRNA2_/MRDRNA2_73443_c0_seq2.p1 gnl/MRDRNA2_/MRDRNA2_73443_c0~~gnl/MRDRNA2_/MRDRNA2_73443_c0_seq2.p1  ORF type:complete len:1392 (+),score=338.23 gnl/MRDRNA2_/MRDRNA2_73443_c0_seq2:161-4336(+)